MTQGVVMHWIALQPQLEGALPEPCDPFQVLSDPLLALGWWALQYTPKVAQVANALVLEVSASERLWGGAKQLLQHIHASNKPVPHVQYARGTTSLIALARLSDRGLVRTQPDELPLQSLAAAQPHLATLERIGCTCWGQLRALPRGGVARRFGAPLLDALDRAYGLKPELYPWLVLPEVFEATLELGAQVETAPALMFGARRLLGSLKLWLQLRQSGVLAIELMWTMDARRNTATQGQLIVRSAEPTADITHLQRLLAEHLARITLPSPVLYLRLRSIEVQKLTGESASLLIEEQRRGDSLQQLLERLGARLGPQQVLQLQVCADHRPEWMQRWEPALSAAKLMATCENSPLTRGLQDGKPWPDQQAAALYPSWLLATPLKLAQHEDRPLYQGPLTLLAGPQRLEAAWWDGAGCTLRDYYLARSEQVGLLWVYRERLGRSVGTTPKVGAVELAWYLHGIFA